MKNKKARATIAMKLPVPGYDYSYLEYIAEYEADLADDEDYLACSKDLYQTGKEAIQSEMRPWLKEIRAKLKELEAQTKQNGQAAQQAPPASAPADKPASQGKGNGGGKMQWPEFVRRAQDCVDSGRMRENSAEFLAAMIETVKSKKFVSPKQADVLLEKEIECGFEKK